MILFLLIAFFAVAVRSAVPGETRPPISRCADALALSRTEAEEDRPVHVRAMVTCYEPAAQLCFVQDDSAGIYVFPATWPIGIKYGDVVEVAGVTGAGRFSPIIKLATVRGTGVTTNLTARKIAIEELNTGRYDSQWIEIEGVVQDVSFATKTCTLRVWTGGSSATVLAFGFTNAPANLLDAGVRCRGVGGTFYRESELSGFGLFAERAQDIEVISPAAPPFSAPVRPARHPAWFARDGRLDHRVQIEGVATVMWPGEAIFLQDGSGAIRVAPAAREEGVHAGDTVEAAGFLRNLTGVPWLDGAVLRRAQRHLPMPEPPAVPIAQFLSRQPSGQYLSAEGLVRDIRLLESGLALFELQAGNSAISVAARLDSIADLQAGARVRASGAWSQPPRDLQGQIGPVLWLNSKAALAMLAPPKPPAAALSTSPGKALAACAIGALLVAGVAALRGRQRTARLAAQASNAAAKMGEMERELDRLNEDREGLGRDLHDRIIQSIYAIGLNLDDCARTAQSDPPKVESRLKSALGDLNTVIAELRSVILGLETNAIQPRELKTALKSLSLALGRDEANRIRLRIDEDALNALTPAQATELVHIAREGLSNSLRHSGAQTTTFGLEVHDGKIIFTIEDDGRGFNPRTAEGKGFGLRNMAKRAENLGASFSIRSEDGQGTRVLLDIPQRKQHFSITTK